MIMNLHRVNISAGSFAKQCQSVKVFESGFGSRIKSGTNKAKWFTESKHKCFIELDVFLKLGNRRCKRIYCSYSIDQTESLSTVMLDFDHRKPGSESRSGFDESESAKLLGTG